MKMQHVNFCNSAESDISCSKSPFRLRHCNRAVFMVLFLFSISFCYAQDNAQQRDKALLVNLAQPILGQLEVGVLLPTKSDFSFFLYSKYNFNYVPNDIEYNYNYLSGTPILYYEAWEAKESGYTLGGQIRRSINTKANKNLDNYKKHLATVPEKAKYYYGLWFEYGNSFSESVVNYVYFNVDEPFPYSTLNWTNIAGGALIGTELNLTKFLVVDTYGGLGYRNLDAQFNEATFLYDEPNQKQIYNGVQVTNRVSNEIVPRFALQLGYQF
jgi:hypothetical protein